MRILSKDTLNNVGKEVILAGWVDSRRDHGKLIFIDLRDRAGITQIVFNAKEEGLWEDANKLRPEWVIKIKGDVSERPDNMKNSDIETGRVEVKVSELKILSEAETPPFEVGDDSYDVNEEIRMKYRYIDLRKKRLSENIKQRSRVNKFIRDFLTEEGFIEVETPILTKSTPEGARDYLVPSRQQNGKFYALPQSPQQYKQMLMVAGLEKYFQIARCFRDEDTRGDRQPEFTQLDVEMSFTTQEEIMKLIERLYTNLVKELYPNKKITKNPWPRIDYKDAMKKHGTDRPDLRKNKDDENELAFAWIVNFPLFEEEKTGKHYAPSHHMFTSPIEKDIEKLDFTPEEVRSHQYDIVLNGFEVSGGSIRIHDPEVQTKIFDLIGFSKKEKEYFEHMLEAFKYGVPPHGGIASGLDRLIAILQNEPNIREVIAFPKTGDGRDLMMDAPSDVDKEQLKELGIDIKKNK